MVVGLPLDDPRPTFPSLLRDRGFHTMAVVNDGYSQFLSKKAGVDEGFVDFKETDSLPAAERNDVGTTKLALESLRQRPADKPFLLWVHYFGPHDPSTTHIEVPRYGKSVRDRYDHEIRFADYAVAPLLAEVDRISESQPTAVFVTADHGENLLPRRRLHGSGVHEVTTRVPMIMRVPGVPPGRSEALVSTLDIPTTVLRMTGTRGSLRMDGMDLREIATGGGPDARIVVSETWRYRTNGKPYYDVVGVFDGQYKLVFFRVKNQMRLVRQDDLSKPAKNWFNEVKMPHLEKAMADYLEQTGGPPKIHP
jgi:arylsulfatase A-like enzyme